MSFKSWSTTPKLETAAAPTADNAKAVAAKQPTATPTPDKK